MTRPVGARGATLPRQSENDWRDGTVIPFARLKGWRVAFTYDSKHSPSGWPDLVLARGERLLIRELKTERGVVSDAQQEWLAALERVGVDAKVWRPSDWPTIQAELE